VVVGGDDVRGAVAQAGVVDTITGAKAVMNKSRGKWAVDRGGVLGFTIAFCFLPSALCLMAFLLLTYFHRSVR
jgi:hypothetical protein